jgi:hypothetical protein
MEKKTNKQKWLEYMAKIAGSKKHKGLSPYRHLDVPDDDTELVFEDAALSIPKIVWTVVLYFDGATRDEYDIYLN